MNIHKNASMTPKGRASLARRPGDQNRWRKPHSHASRAGACRSRRTERPQAAAYGPRDTGAGGSGSGCPPGPATNVSGETASCWPTPRLLQSHTPPGNTA